VNKVRRSAIVWLILAVVGIVVVTRLVSSGTSREKLDVSSYEQLLKGKQVATATLYDGDHVIKGDLKDQRQYSVTYPDGYTEQITSKTIAAGVKMKTDQQRSSAWWDLFINFGPILLLIGIGVYFFNHAQGGGSRVMSFGKSRAKVVSKDSPQTTFADVAGLDEAVEELQEIKEFLASPSKFQDMGAKIPKGVLLYGPPGTGKTLLAKAVAGEAGVPFFSISGSDFVEMFVGVGASRVRDLFEQAKASAPAIVFVDEIDAVGRHRGAGLGGGHDEREQTLNQLLVEMDGFDMKQGVILLASTNRPDILDPALLRPGRFDRQIVVDRPDLEGRKAILRVHAQQKPLAAGVDLDVIARRTPGFTGADLANVMNEAALLTARHSLKEIGLVQLEEAIDRVMAGPERRSRLISDKEKLVIAYHEGGHALVSHALPNTDPVHKVSIIPRGRALGYTLTLPMEDKFLVTRSELIDELAMLLGGRTAEELVFADPTTGAQNDIERATVVARQMVTEYGMTDSLGPMRLGRAQGEVFLGRDFASEPDYSEEVAAAIDSEVRSLIDRAHHVARDILETNRATLDALAEALIEHETLDTDAVQAVLRPVEIWTGTESGVGRASVVAASDSSTAPQPRRAGS
jgi:cell division protease FtsH